MFKVGEIWKHRVGSQWKILADYGDLHYKIENIETKEQVNNYHLPEYAQKFWTLIKPVIIEEYI